MACYGDSFTFYCYFYDTNKSNIIKQAGCDIINGLDLYSKRTWFESWLEHQVLLLLLILLVVVVVVVVLLIFFFVVFSVLPSKYHDLTCI
jgi:Na+/glutamate symporter